MTKSGGKFWRLSYWSSTWEQLPNSQRNIFRCIVLVHFLLTAWLISYQTITLDEPEYFWYMLRWVRGHPEKLYPLTDSKTPMLALSLIPGLIKPWLPASLLQTEQFFYVYAGRPFTYLYQLLGSYMVFCWLYRLWGGKKWIVPLLFFCFDPLIFSYGMFVASDLPSASLLVTIIYAAWRFTNTGQTKYWWTLCVAAAFAVLLKQSMIYCYPLLVILLWYKAIGKTGYNKKKAALQVLQFALMQWLLINTLYYFSGFGTSFGSIHFQSTTFSRLQQNLHVFENLPIPLPLPFIQGFDWLQHNAEFGGCKLESTYPGVWLLGRHECQQGIWYYYLLTAAFKLPLLVWVVFFAFVGRLLFRTGFKQKLKANIFIWLPFLYFLLILSLTNKFQIGIRHAIPLLPFFYIGISGVFVWLYGKRKWLFIGFGLLHFVSVARYWPNIMAYTNELIWNKTAAYTYIRDSSIDYGQSGSALKSFFKKHPDYKPPLHVADTGRFAITIQDLTTEFSDPGQPSPNYRWLLDNFQPIDNYRYTILLFEITNSDLKKAGLR